ncbi:MAG: tRNA 2-thiouridine(34) synthase MnmA [Bdellovibrionales bacterium]|nr:tRNA 2-thiouridine(34) synthase MnmA [Bdellovibrionales bacterium]
MKTVVLGMSGGVDSSVAALLLKQQGYRVIGLFMKNWEEKDESGICTATQDYEDVARVCEKLEIPYYSIEFVKEYWDHVFSEFLRAYQAGYTPNPDILCNREIKFNLFFKKAMEMGADYLATGHYCRIESRDGAPRLLKAIDQNKDQTYFVYTIQNSILHKVLFPVGHLTKPELRTLAETHGIPTAQKKDSTGICFIGERNFRKFLSQYVPAKKGEIRTLSGEQVGSHQGVSYYTLGQRKGLGLGGEGEAWFVVAKDALHNILYVERGVMNPALYADELWAGELSWVQGEAPVTAGSTLECTAKARYRQPEQPCSISFDDHGKIRARFHIPQRALTPGQSVVFYQGEECLGGGVIEKVGPSYREQGANLPDQIDVPSN